MVRKILSCYVALFIFAGVGWAQSSDETLADIRNGLSLLKVEIEALRAEKGEAKANEKVLVIPPGFFERIELFEREIARLTDLTERLEFRIDRVVRDGTNKIGDLAFQLCEIDPTCSLGNLAFSPTRIGEGNFDGGAPKDGEVIGLILDGQSPAPVSAGNKRDNQAVILSEEKAFEQAKQVFSEGDYRRAIDLLLGFIESFSESAFLPEAYFMRGEAHVKLGQWIEAGEAYLGGFEDNPDSPFAPKSLLGLGRSLVELDYLEDACTIMREVSNRYARSESATQAKKDFVSYKCF